MLEINEFNCEVKVFMRNIILLSLGLLIFTTNITFADVYTKRISDLGAVRFVQRYNDANYYKYNEMNYFVPQKKKLLNIGVI